MNTNQVQERTVFCWLRVPNGIAEMKRFWAFSRVIFQWGILMNSVQARAAHLAVLGLMHSKNDFASPSIRIIIYAFAFI